jgi:hypothetical protein
MPDVLQVRVPNGKAAVVWGLRNPDVSSLLFINIDTASTVYIGNTSNITPTSPNVVPLPPGGTFNGDAKSNWYVTGATAGIQPLVVVPGGSSYSPGTIDIGTVTGSIDIAAVAGNVDVIGSGGSFPPGTLGNIYNSGPGLTNIAAGTITNLSGSISTASYASVVLYVTGITNSSQAAGAAVCSIFTLIWYDTLSNPIAKDTVSLLLGSAVSATWEMPVRGATVTLSCQNIGTVGTITVGNSPNVVLDGSYRIIPSIRAINTLMVAGGITTLLGDTIIVPASPVFQVNGWIASLDLGARAAGIYVIPLPLWVGQVIGSYIVLTAASTSLQFIDMTNMVQGNNAAGASYPGIILPLSNSVGTAVAPFNYLSPPSQLALIYEPAATTVLELQATAITPA